MRATYLQRGLASTRASAGRSAGFTLLEMLVSVGIFSVLIVASISVLISIQVAQKKAASIQAVQDNIRFALGFVVKELTQGKNYVGGGCGGSDRCDSIAFLSAAGETVGYCRDAGVIKRTLGAQTCPEGSPMTSNNIEITSLIFYVLGENPGPADGQPRVTIALSGRMRTAIQKVQSVYQLQTTVTQRVRDVESGALPPPESGCSPQTFAYSGGQQTWVVPINVTSIAVDAKGAEGGDGSNGAPGGLGARVQAVFSVTPGEDLYLFIGGAGTALSGTPGGGGYNGGGSGGGFYGTEEGGSGGGGATDIRRGGTALSDRIIAAGGGGGAGNHTVDENLGGGEGGTNGGDARIASGLPVIAAKGGTQTAGGAGGKGYLKRGTYKSIGGSGSLGNGGNGNVAGGGGGGYYGGGGGAYDTDESTTWGYSGGGGSSLVPAGGTAEAGYKSGNGELTITCQ